MASVFQNGLWTCGFDMLATGNLTSGSIAGMWDQFNGGGFGISANPSWARFTGKGLNCSQNAYLGRTLGTNLSSMIVAFAFWTPTLPSSTNIQSFLTLASSTSTILTLGYNNLGQLGAYAAGGLLNGNASSQIGSLTAQNTVVPSTYNLYEISFSATQVIVRLNTNVILTVNSSFASVNQVYIGSQNTNISVYFDDFYMLDLTGAAPLNAFLGNTRIQTDVPTGDSATGGLNAWAFTTPQGTDYGNCANIGPNTADYNSSATLNARMSLTFPTLSATQCFALNTWFMAEEDAAGTRGIVAIYRNNNVDQVGGNSVNLSQSYAYYNQVSTIDPNTGAMWVTEPASVAGGCEIGLSVNV